MGVMEQDGAQKDFIASLAKGLTVMRAFSREVPSMTLSEAARRTDMTRAGARRILLTLETLGYVEQEEGRFSLTPKTLDLGFGYLGSTEWWQVAVPHMECVSKEVSESCSAAVLDGTEIVYAAHVPANRVMSVALSLGARLPAYCTSMGRVLLAALPEEEALALLAGTDRRQMTPQTLVDVDALMSEVAKVRRQGFAFVDQELEGGLRSISVPITNRRGKVLAAINVSSHASRAGVSEMTGVYLTSLQKAAKAIQGQMP